MNREIPDYISLSDINLIKLFCSDPPDREAMGELWKRYEPKIRSFARNLARMCPSSHSRDSFSDEVFSEMQERVIRQVCGYQQRVPFSAWLWMVGQGVAIDKRRKITGRNPRLPRSFVPLTEEEAARSGALFRDKATEDPVRRVLEGERAARVREVFERYSEKQEGFESLSALFLHFHEECTVGEVAKHFCTYERKVFRMFDHDCEALQALFVEAGIRNLRDLVMD